MAVSSWRAILKILSLNYEQRLHQASLLVVKTICQYIVRKLDAAVCSNSSSGSQQQLNFKGNLALIAPMKIIVRSLLECLQMFPSTFKHILGSGRGGQRKKEFLMNVVEEVVRTFSEINDEITSDALRFLSLSFRARDKSKVNYSNLLNRILSNLLLLLEGIKPRGIDDVEEIQQPLPIEDLCFSFIFDPSDSQNHESLDKLTLRDLREHLRNRSIVLRKVKLLFDLLKMTLGQDQVRSEHQMAGQGEMLLTVNINLKEVVGTIGSILKKSY